MGGSPKEGISHEGNVTVRFVSLSRSLVRLIRSQTTGAHDLEAAERYVRDWLGSTVAGRATQPGAALTAYGQAIADLDGQIFLAAALSHITETDDLHRGSVTHPGCVVIPTALILTHKMGGTGAQALRAVLAGYEAVLRVGEALGEEHYRIFHNTATAGVFGSTAAACTVLDLEEEAWVWAMGNAGTQASGLWQFNQDATMSKHLHAGNAAAAGVRAALLAARGFTGPSEILEGTKGFFRGFCPDPIPAAITSEAAGWKLPETSMKPYPCCRHTHPAVDAALELRDSLRRGTAIDLTPDRIESIRILTYPAALEFTNQPRPTTPYAAKFSIQYCVAKSFAGGPLKLTSFEPAELEDDVLEKWLEKIKVEPNTKFEAAYPSHWGAEVVATSVDGSIHRASRADALGDPEQPLDDDWLDRKTLGLLEYGGIRDTAASDLLRECRGLPQATRIFSLPRLEARKS
ncbi:MAG: MmgE/PrpD family protein [Gemmatimonadota bacterium]|nr:MmgE/PrpD family protein [Gemmatimonadota bacterium]